MNQSKSSKYAIRSILYLARQEPGLLATLERIAESQKIPRHFLAKIMQRLVRKRLVKSVKGPNGGFVLSVPADKITLYAILDAVDDLSMSMQDCFLGYGACSESERCPAHDAWKELREKELAFFRNLTIAKMVDNEVFK